MSLLSKTAKAAALPNFDHPLPKSAPPASIDLVESLVLVECMQLTYEFSMGRSATNGATTVWAKWTVSEAADPSNVLMAPTPTDAAGMREFLIRVLGSIKISVESERCRLLAVPA